MNSTVIVKNAIKHFGKVKALDGVSLSVSQGSIFGLLGPNGAGKTTLIRMLSTLLEPDSGSLSIMGHDVVKEAAQVRGLIGLAGQYAAVDDFMTGRETLEMVACLYHVPKAEAKKRSAELLERFSLVDAADRPARTYSGGMRRRLDLGASLVGRPDVLLLDEPTTGLDPRTRQEVWELIRELVQEGRTIILTTQYLDEADALCGYISIIDRGKTVLDGTPAQLKASLGTEVLELHVELKNQAEAIEIMRKVSHSTPRIHEADASLSFRTSSGAKHLLQLSQELSQAGIKPTDLSLHRPSLDDVFLSVTGKRTRSGKRRAK